MRRPRCSLFKICVVEDDVRTLPSELESDLLQVALRCRLHDLAADESAAGEGDLLDQGMFADRLADGVAITSDDVDDARGEPSFVDQATDSDGRQRCEFGRLQGRNVISPAAI